MSPATDAKAAAIRAAMHPYSHPEGLTPPVLLAMLTSADKGERERAKREVRELVRAGAAILAEQKNAADLASFANRHEP